MKPNEECVRLLWWKPAQYSGYSSVTEPYPWKPGVNTGMGLMTSSSASSQVAAISAKLSE